MACAGARPGVWGAWHTACAGGAGDAWHAGAAIPAWRAGVRDGPGLLPRHGAVARRVRRRAEAARGGCVRACVPATRAARARPGPGGPNSATMRTRRLAPSLPPCVRAQLNRPTRPPSPRWTSWPASPTCWPPPGERCVRSRASPTHARHTPGWSAGGAPGSMHHSHAWSPWPSPVGSCAGVQLRGSAHDGAHPPAHGHHQQLAAAGRRALPPLCGHWRGLHRRRPGRAPGRRGRRAGQRV